VECDVRRNDEIAVAEVGQLKPAGVLLSPGPGTPDRAGIMLDLIRAYADDDADLRRLPRPPGHRRGVRGGRHRAPELLHGKTSEVTHDGAGVLRGLPDPFTATRYHSLAVVESTLPDEIEVTGRTADSGLVMAMRHRTLPLEGCSSTPSRCSPRAGTSCWPTGWPHRLPGRARRARNWRPRSRPAGSPPSPDPADPMPGARTYQGRVGR
jgi:para-aminobenzoate synthetase component 2